MSQFEEKHLVEKLPIETSPITGRPTILWGRWAQHPVENAAYEATNECKGGLSIFSDQITKAATFMKKRANGAVVIMGDCLDDDLGPACDILKESILETQSHLKINVVPLKVAVENEVRNAALVYW